MGSAKPTGIHRIVSLLCCRVRAAAHPNGPPLKPEEIIMIGKLRRALQRREYRSPVDLQASFAVVDRAGSGKLAWSEVARVLHDELRLDIATEGCAFLVSTVELDSSILFF